MLIIHTGGTIGMFRDDNGKFAPQKHRFEKFLEDYPYFSDQDETYFLGEDGFTITPETIFKKRIWYKFLELETLIDSSNLNLEHINTLLGVIKTHYDGTALSLRLRRLCGAARHRHHELLVQRHFLHD